MSVYRVRLTASGSNTIAVIRTVREITGLGLKEAKGLVDGLGIVAKDLRRRDAEKVQEKLAAVGARIRLEPSSTPEPKLDPVPQPVPAVDQGGGAYHVRLISSGGNKIAVIQEVRKITGLGLKEAKDLVDGLGVVAEDLSRSAATKIQEKLALAGAKSEILPARTHKLEPEPDPVVLEPMPQPAEPSDHDAFNVFGQVLLSNGQPVEACTVRAFDRDLRSEQLLGETRTDRMGSYRITYTTEQFERAEMGTADLVVRAYNPVGRLLVESDILFNASQHERIDLEVSESTPVQPSEYEQLVSLLTPLLEGVPLTELNGDDVWFLANETGRSLKEIAFVADDARLSQAAAMPEAVFFGLAVNQVGVVEGEQVEDARPQPPRVDLNTMMREPLERLFDVVTGAIESRLVPSALRDRRGEIWQRFMELKTSWRAEGQGRS
jgi:ribosomal protein L7/L12